jgi:ketosteroid isomerase-like protein
MATTAPLPTTETLRATVARYAETVTARNAEAYGALFTPDAVQVDPYPTAPNVGREAIRDFMQRSIDGSQTMLFEVAEVHPVADKAAFAFHITLDLEGGAVMHIRGIEVFTVTEVGLISAVDAYWGEQDVAFD